jgi:CubicO group peptidase (beta-lactamase class C family)
MKPHYSLLLAVLAIPILFSAPMKTSAEKAAAVDELFRDYAQPSVPGASVIVIENGKVLFQKAYGLANVEAKIAATTNTNYRLASVSKQFTAMAIMILAERKKLSYDDNLAGFFPGFPEYGKQITVRHLLNHSSGLIAYEDVMDDNSTVPLTDRDVLELLKRQDHTHFPPGSSYRYSNSGYVLLGLIVEKASGTSFPEFLRANIFAPLRMNHTVFYPREDRSDEGRRAYGYSKRDDVFVRTDQSLTSSTLGDGAIYSSVADLYKWDQGLRKSRLVKRDTLQMAFTPGAQVDDDTGYGFGWFVETRRGLKTVSHSGNTIGCTQFIRRYLDRKFTIVVQANRSNAPLAPLVDKIEEIYFESR